MLQGLRYTPTPYQPLGTRTNPTIETLDTYSLVPQGFDGPTHSSFEFAPTASP